MENVNSEVSEKVKNAIKAKLMELGAYVDDELPDYIMILVGNKKTKDQMDDDLSLFLGHNTERFTSWLHIVLQKLNAASMLSSSKSEKTSPKIVDTTDKKKHKKKKDKSDKDKNDKDKGEKEKKKEKKEKKKKKKEEKNSSKRKRETSDNGVKTKEEQSESIETWSSHSPVVKESPNPNKNEEDEDDLAEDVVDLRPGAADFALDLDEELPIKKKRVRLAQSDEEVTDSKPLPLGLVFQDVKPKKKVIVVPKHSDDELTPKTKSLPLGLVYQETKSKKKTVVSDEEMSKPLSLVFKVTNDRVKSPSPPSEVETVDSVHDRLRPISSNGSSSKRIINLREESSFPPSNASAKENGVMNRFVTNAISSAVRSVSAKISDDVKPSKKLEARINPVNSSRLKEEAPTRLVSKVAIVQKRPHSSEEDESDDSSDEPRPKKLSGVASKVEIPRARRGKTSHANSALILRAVADAHKSVTRPSKRSLEEKEELHPIEKKQKMFTRSYQERKDAQLSPDEERNSKKVARSTKESVHMRLGSTKSSLKKEVEESEDDLDNLEAIEEGPEKPPHMELQTKKAMKARTNDVNTRFIITMDGAGNDKDDLRSRLTGKSVHAPSIEEEEEEDEEEELIEEVEEWEEIEEVEVPATEMDQSTAGEVTYGSKLKLIKHDATVAKKKELCVFWPQCKEGESCIFIHPIKMNKICTSFPNCRFANKCLYIHPKCKFDATCVKVNCPFTHSAPKHTPITTAVLKPKFGSLSAPKCRYFPKCTDVNCPFTHPVKNLLQICHYGAMCHTVNCQFIHPEVPSNTALKWTAPKVSGSTNANCSPPTDVLTSLSKKIEDLNSLVKKTEKAQVNEELLKLKKMTAILESATT